MKAELTPEQKQEKAKHSIQGRRNKLAGAAFEQFLETQHERAKHLGILAHITKTEPTATFVRGKLIYTAKSVADFVGTLDRGGRTIAIEAKSTVDRFYKNEVSDKQQDHLTRVANAGGLALFAIEFRSRFIVQPQRFIIPWLDVPWTVAKTAESLTLAGLKEWPRLCEHNACYLSMFHPAGEPTTVTARRTFHRE